MRVATARMQASDQPADGRSASAHQELSVGQMVLANRPWRLVRDLSKVLVATLVNSHRKMSVDDHRKLSVGWRQSTGWRSASSRPLRRKLGPLMVSTSASWSRRSRIAAASASSPKVSAHSATVLLDVTMVEPRV